MPYTRVNDAEKLRRLMGAVLMITADVELGDLLPHLWKRPGPWSVPATPRLAYSTDRTGLEQFITVGLSEAEEARHRRSPHGPGRARAADHGARCPLRLTHLEEHPGRYGFPTNTRP